MRLGRPFEAKGLSFYVSTSVSCWKGLSREGWNCQQGSPAEASDQRGTHPRAVNSQLSQRLGQHVSALIPRGDARGTPQHPL